MAAFEKEKRAALEEAYQEARKLVLDIKRQAYQALEEARRQKTRKPVRAIEKTQKELDERLREFRREPTLALDEIGEGDVVFVRSFGFDAEVTAVDRRRGRLRVRAGQMSLEVPVTEVGPGTGAPAEPGPWRGAEAEAETPKASLNIVGLRVDEALSRLEPFLNDAYLSGLGEVTIIHGIGTGALKKAVWSHLKGHPLVAGLGKAEQQEGGGGVTVARLK
jgi:DNA mismatch repair protein MutS2